MKYTPADVTAVLLITHSLGTDPINKSKWPVFVGPMPDDPHEVIVVTNVPTPSQGRIHRSGETISFPGLMVRTRSSNSNIAQNKAIEIYSLFDTIRREIVVVEELAYRVQAIHNQTSPADMGKDESRRYVFSINSITSIKEVS